MRRPPSERGAAVKAFYWARGYLPLAVLLLPTFAPDARIGNPYHFIPYWVNNFETRHSVHDKKPRGRQSSIGEPLVRECMTLLEAGYRNDTGEHRFYRSIRHACLVCPRLAEILSQKHVKRQQLLRRMKAVCPELCRRTLRFIRWLGPAAKAERLAYCARHMVRADVTLEAHLARYMWIDSKIVYVVPKGCLVYAPSNADLYIEDARLPNSASQIKKIHYYVVVNAVIGPVYFKLVTGTTGIRECLSRYPQGGYQVRGDWGQLTQPPPRTHRRRWPAGTSSGCLLSLLPLPAAAARPTAADQHGGSALAASGAGGTAC